MGGRLRGLRTTWKRAAIPLAERRDSRTAARAARRLVCVAVAGVAAWAWCTWASAEQAGAPQHASWEERRAPGEAHDAFSDPLAGLSRRDRSDLEDALSEMEWLLDVEPDDTRPGLKHLVAKCLLAWPLYGGNNAVELLTQPRSDIYEALVRRHLIRSMANLAPIQARPGGIAMDFHVHTCHSHDSMADVRQVIEAAARRGLAGVAITDHDTMSGAQEARRIASQMIAEGTLPADFLVIEGEEVSSSQGHIVGLFLSREIPPELSAAETVEAIHAAGGLAVAAHPMLKSGVGALAATLPFDAVEIRNGAEEMEFAFATRSARMRRAAFYAGVTKPRLGSSDAHDPAAVGVCYTSLECAPTAEAVRAAILAGRTSARSEWSEGPARHLARRCLVGRLLALRAAARSATGKMEAWLCDATQADKARVSLWPQPGVTLEKEF